MYKLYTSSPLFVFHLFHTSRLFIYQEGTDRINQSDPHYTLFQWYIVSFNGIVYPYKTISLHTICQPTRRCMKVCIIFRRKFVRWENFGLFFQKEPRCTATINLKYCCCRSVKYSVNFLSTSKYIPMHFTFFSQLPLDHLLSKYQCTFFICLFPIWKIRLRYTLHHAVLLHRLLHWQT